MSTVKCMSCQRMTGNIMTLLCNNCAAPFPPELPTSVLPAFGVRRLPNGMILPYMMPDFDSSATTIVYDLGGKDESVEYSYGTPAQLEQDMLDDQERELKADKPDEREGVEL